LLSTASAKILSMTGEWLASVWWAYFSPHPSVSVWST